MIQVDREVGDAFIGSRRTAELGRIAMAQAVQRNRILAHRVAIVIIISHFYLERPGIVAGVVNLAVNGDLALRPHELNF